MVFEYKIDATYTGVLGREVLEFLKTDERFRDLSTQDALEKLFRTENARNNEFYGSWFLPDVEVTDFIVRESTKTCRACDKGRDDGHTCVVCKACNLDLLKSAKTPLDLHTCAQ